MKIDKQSVIISTVVLVGSSVTQYLLYRHIDWAYSILTAIVFIVLAPYINKKNN
ncbi:hypothetical protein [Desulforamulus hydrothermalis]|uniref:Uncharacterized protein n=1 Tax=Desulforamulus hydrothermalis Lam5 = DSM 18033 TaxID=1121428 RepID=K8E0H6_9FIRM|nr:hypothetical protein [Desulforamulus hydrothermalis]CCO09062.1 hypothetical protein DESHY_60234 [Desulforamulus hydrothermalis Lam5 = DSM 18033]SHG78163.1 hypothetical protein SAMN02745177_00379 [Desulforamulus hydrothermalis Lam5 = DSM 18033]